MFPDQRVAAHCQFRERYPPFYRIEQAILEVRIAQMGFRSKAKDAWAVMERLPNPQHVKVSPPVPPFSFSSALHQNKCHRRVGQSGAVPEGPGIAEGPLPPEDRPAPGGGQSHPVGRELRTVEDGRNGRVEEEIDSGTVLFGGLAGSDREESKDGRVGLAVQHLREHLQVVRRPRRPLVRGRLPREGRRRTV